MTEQVLNQASYQDIQNFDIDIDKIYNDFILAIDKVRSYNNTSSISSQSAISFFQSKNLSKLRSSVSTEITPQESRCHAFLRIIDLVLTMTVFFTS